MKKITILCLHLGYGGVEKAVTSLANLLCIDNRVEIISIYQLYDKPVFEVDDRVEIKYLLKEVPNKSKIKLAIKKLKVLTLIKEGFLALKILYNKKTKTIDAIKNIDADIIISSRIFISQLLAEHGPKKSIKIAQEHRHHNNDLKYINAVKKVSEKIDYLMPVSRELTDFFTNEIKVKNCYYIPHFLDYIPEEVSTLDEKNIISIGRLSPEKGFQDLIDVFYGVYKKYPEWKLNIVGDGVERDQLEEKITNLKLGKNVILHGYKNREKINELLKKSSIYVMTSKEESFGLVLLEAGSFGIPSVLFNSASGSLEIIKNNFNGYVISNRDNGDMVKKINNLIENYDMRKKLGINARENASKYSFDNIKEQWELFLNNL